MEKNESRFREEKMPNDCTLAEYRKHYAPEYLRKNIVNLALCGYLVGIANAVMGFMYGDILRVSLAVVMTAMNLGLHMKKSKLCAILILICACGDLLQSLVTGGALSTWGGWIALAVYALFAINNMDKEFKREIRMRNREY